MLQILPLPASIYVLLVHAVLGRWPLDVLQRYRGQHQTAGPVKHWDREKAFFIFFFLLERTEPFRTGHWTRDGTGAYWTVSNRSLNTWWQGWTRVVFKLYFTLVVTKQSYRALWEPRKLKLLVSGRKQWYKLSSVMFHSLSFVGLVMSQ